MIYIKIIQSINKAALCANTHSEVGEQIQPVVTQAPLFPATKNETAPSKQKLWTVRYCTKKKYFKLIPFS